MQKITPMLCFDHQAEQAAEHYISVFSKRPGRARPAASWSCASSSRATSSPP